jgi:hypothetical protein
VGGVVGGIILFVVIYFFLRGGGNEEQPPNITVTNPPTSPYTTKKSPLILEGIVSPPDSELYVTVNGKQIPVSVSEGRFTASVPLKEGENRILISANGEPIPVTKTLGVTYSKGPDGEPVDVKVKPEPPEFTNQETLTLKGTVSPANSKLDVNVNGEQSPVTVSKDQFTKEVTLKEGENTIVITDSRNKSKLWERNVMLDTKKPQLNISEEPKSTPTDRVTITGNVQDDNSGVKELHLLSYNKSSISFDTKGEFSKEVTGLSRGWNNIQFRAVDKAGNKSEIAEHKVFSERKDVIQPPIQITLNPEPPPFTNKSPYILEGTVSPPDSELDVNGEQIRISKGSFKKSVPLNEGGNTIVITPHGSQSVLKTVNITLDTHSPQLNIYGPSFTSMDSVTITGNVQDVLSGVEKLSILSPYESSISFDAKGEFSTELTGLSEGRNEIQLQAVDKAGNKSEIAKHVVIKDTEKPTLSVSPLSPYIPTTTIEVKGTVSDKNFKELKVNGKPTQVDSSTGDFTATVSNLPQGENEISIKALDLAGNETPLTRKVTVDQTPPVIEHLIPAEGQTVKEGDPVQGKASDNLGIKRIEIKLDGKTLENVNLEPSGEFKGKLPVLKEGQHTLEVTAFDLADNSSKPFERNIVVPPPVTPSSGPLQKAVAEVEKGNYSRAIELFKAVPESLQKDFLTAQWNIATLSLYYSATLDPDKALQALQSIETVAYEKNDKAAYLQLFKGLAHYEKGEKIRLQSQAAKAIVEYKVAAEAFEAAYQKRSIFSKTNLENVRHFGPLKNVSDAMGYMAMSYYRLYKWSNNKKDARGYNSMAITRLNDYAENLDKLFSIPDDKKPYYKSEDFESLYEAAKEAAEELDTDLAKKFQKLAEEFKK